MSSHGPAKPMTSRRAHGLSGTAPIPGDKSISHRSLILGALSIGETQISGLLEGQDVLDTAAAMSAFGASVTNHGDGNWSVVGLGTGGWHEPEDVINYGNAGTGVRLVMGAMATMPIVATFTGDASLRSRPMARITDPITLFGAQSHGRSGGRLPLTLIGSGDATGIDYVSPMASAQVKSAVLLAGLNARGETHVTEKVATRDHTERMLRGFGAEIEVEAGADGHRITLVGQPELTGQTIAVPRDPSSAAFPICAALIVPGSDILVPNIGLNPTRAGLLTTLLEMGGDIEVLNQREEGGEPTADLRVRHSVLKGIDVPPERAASMIDEYPILSVVASFAEGVTRMTGVEELRVKESDRIDAMARGLEAAGVKIEEGKDSFTVNGLGPEGVKGGITAKTHLDHRIAMSYLCLGMASQKPVKIDDAQPVLTSFPNFVPLMKELGATLSYDNH